MPEDGGNVQVVVKDDSKSDVTREFFMMVQNRFHYAITGQTAPEIIYTHADHIRQRGTKNVGRKKMISN